MITIQELDVHRRDRSSFSVNGEQYHVYYATMAGIKIISDKTNEVVFEGSWVEAVHWIQCKTQKINSQ